MAEVETPVRDDDRQDESTGLGSCHVKKLRTSNDDDRSTRDLPSCEAYEKSYMHREVISHIIVTKTQFVITASVDGVIKFWKKNKNGIEFVKSFKSHAGPVEDISVTPSGSELASISRKDKTVKIFDIVNFDMINMFSLDFEPRCVEWINQSVISKENLILTDSNSSSIYTYDARQSTNEPKNTISRLHSSVIGRIRLNSVHNIIVSADTSGIVKYWRVKEKSYDCIRHPNATAQHDTVLHEFIDTNPSDIDKSSPTQLHDICFSPDGNFMAITSSDRKIRVYKFKSAKLVREFDESLASVEARQKKQPFMNNMDFARKLAIEREIDKNRITSRENVMFDQTNEHLLFPTMFGVKIYNWKRNKLIRTLGKDETNFRPLNIGLFQGLIHDKLIRRYNSDDVDSGTSDPTLFCSSYKKNRFYCFSNRHFEEDVTEGEGGEVIKDRDIYNEKPSREEMIR